MQLGLAEFAEYCLRTLRLLRELGLAALRLEFWEGWLNEHPPEICSLSPMLGSFLNTSKLEVSLIYV